MADTTTGKQFLATITRVALVLTTTRSKSLITNLYHMNTTKKIKKWFEINAGWFFINGRKTAQWNAYLKNTYGHGLPPLTKMQEIATELLGPTGKKSSFSKLSNSATRVIAPNGKVCVGPHIIWSGDLEVTKNTKVLQLLATSIGEEIYVLRESHGRWFYNNESPYTYYGSSIATFTA